jgi:hypothetical protein
MILSIHRVLKIFAIVCSAAVLIAVIKPRLGAGFFIRLRSIFHHLARDRRKAVVTAAIFPLLVRAAMLPWYPFPPPQVHDEFSYLMQADTFAHGRASNPTPDYWQHFETEYVLMNPTYASQYEPAQGLVLAFGQVVMRHPWWGVWLSMGVMFGAICWALMFVMPNVWALAATVGAGLQFGIFGIWMNSYFGGAVAATAGALVMGSLARMRRERLQRTSAALCAFGIIILFASRPFEAILWSGVAVAFVDLQLRRTPAVSRSRIFRRLLPPFMAVFLAGAVALAWYNWRVTGDPLRPPYLEYQSIYGTPQPYWWGHPLRIASFDFPEIRDNYLNQLSLYNDRYSLSGIFQSEIARLGDFWLFFVGPFFTAGLIFLPWVFRDRRIRPWLWASLPFVLDKTTYHTWFPAQNAPATVLIVLVLAQCWRHLRVAWRRRRIGVAISNQLVAAFVICVTLGGIGRAVEPVLPRQLRHLPPVWEALYPARRLRDDVAARLEAIPGKHLVFVKYAAYHCFCEGWIVNGADIRSQRIVYARPYTPTSDAALARYLNDHDVWVVEPDAHPYRLTRIGDACSKIRRMDGNSE